jgi:hypothetical protein
MAEYQLTTASEVLRLTDMVTIPNDPLNRDRREYDEWLAAGGEPLPCAPLPEPVPASATRLGLMRALKEIDLWGAAKAAIAADPDIQEEWDLAVEVKRTDPLTQAMIASLGLSSLQVDKLLIRSAELVA